MEDVKESSGRTRFDFGHALRALKNGEAVAREGWNGKNMFLFLNKGSIAFDSIHGDDNLPKGSFTEGIENSLFESGGAGTITRLPNINMKAASGSIVTGWLASQTDLLAEDWCILGSSFIMKS